MSSLNFSEKKNRKYFKTTVFDFSNPKLTHTVSDIVLNGTLTFTTLWTNSADDKVMIFFFFLRRKQDLTFHANCLQICMKCQNLNSGKNKKKYFSMSSAEIFTQSAKQ